MLDFQPSLQKSYIGMMAFLQALLSFLDLVCLQANSGEIPIFWKFFLYPSAPVPASAYGIAYKRVASS